MCSLVKVNLPGYVVIMVVICAKHSPISFTKQNPPRLSTMRTPAGHSSGNWQG